MFAIAINELILQGVPLLALGLLVVVWGSIAMLWCARALRAGKFNLGLFAFWLGTVAYLLPWLVAPALSEGASGVQASVISASARLSLLTSLALLGFFILRLLSGRVRLEPVVTVVLLFWAAVLISTLLAGQDAIQIAAFIGLAASVAASRTPYPVVLLHLKWALRLLTVGSLLFFLVMPSQVVQTGASGREILGIGQLYGLTSHPNALGPLAAAALAIEVSVFRKGVMPLVGVGSAAFCLIFAQSRNGWVAALAALFVLGWFRSNLASRLSARLFLAPAALLGLAWASVTIGADGPTDLSTGRFEIWTGLVPLFLDSPVIGNGLGALSADNRAEFGGLISKYAGQAHNQVLQTAIDSGAVGVLLLSILVVMAVRTAARFGSAHQAVLAGLLAVVAVSALVESPLRPVLSGQAPLIFGIIALVSSRPLREGDSTAPTQLDRFESADASADRRGP